MKEDALGRKKQLTSSAVEIREYYIGIMVKGAGSLKKEELNTTSDSVNRYNNIKTDLVLLYLTIRIHSRSCRRAVG